MITGFEDITFELTNKELAYVDVFVKSFKKKIGKSMIISNQEIIRTLESKGFFEHSKYGRLDAVRVRKIIRYIRYNKLIKNLIATSKGYYIENNPDRLAEYKESLIQRARSIYKLALTYDV